MQQLPLITPESDWRPPSEYPRLTDEKILSWDLETKDPNLKAKGPGWSREDGHIVGIGVATRDRSWYFPIRHGAGGNLDPKMTLWWAADLWKKDTTKIIFNGLYDIGWMKAEGLEMGGRVIDPRAACVLANENRRQYNLNSLLKAYDLPTKDEVMLDEVGKAWGMSTKSNLHEFHSSHVGIYGEWDPMCNWNLWDAVRPTLEEEGSLDLFNLEMELYPAWVDMTHRGIRIDELWVEESIATVKREIAEVQDRLGGIDIWNAEDIARVLTKSGIRVPKTKQKKPSIQQPWLERIGTPYANDIIRARKLDKVRGTFLEGMILGNLHKGRIHPDWHPLMDGDNGAITGRVSASNPSPQVFSKRDPVSGMMVRGACLPEEGEKWISSDYRQQEPRWIIDYAYALKLPGVQRMVDAYDEDPDMDYHEMCAKFSGLTKAKVKPINLGVAYGMGRKKMEADLMALGLPKHAAMDVYDTYHRELPYVNKLVEAVSDLAQSRGWIKTKLGRMSHFNQWEPEGNFGKDDDWVVPCTHDEAIAHRDAGDPDWKGRKIVRYGTRLAPNKVIQGTSADQNKKAMLDLWRVGGPLMLCPVHDEQNFSSGDVDRDKKLIREAMEQAIASRIPFRVEIDVSDRWMIQTSEE